MRPLQKDQISRKGAKSAKLLLKKIELASKLMLSTQPFYSLFIIHCSRIIANFYE